MTCGDLDQFRKKLNCAVRSQTQKNQEVAQETEGEMNSQLHCSRVDAEDMTLLESQSGPLIGENK